MSTFRVVRSAPALALLLLLLPRPASAEDGGVEGRLTGNVDVGFDTFQEKYSIVDEDTVDSITEFRSRLALGYKRGSMLDDLFQLDARAMVGDDSFEYTGRFDLIERFGARGARYSRFAVNADISRREYREGSSYEFANDYTRYYLRTYFKWDASRSVTLRLSDRIEALDYENRTEFDYDYVKNSVKLDAEIDWDFTNLVGAGVRFTQMTIPDTTEIQYESWAPEVELRLVPGPHEHLTVYATAERRHYAHEPVRSSFWALLSNAAVELPLGGPLSVEVRDDLERYAYDTDTDAYFDYTESRNALLLKFNRSWNMWVGVGPTFSFFRSEASSDDEYDEWGGKLAVDYIHARSAWLSGAYELGRRRYGEFDSESDIDSIYSDYTYHRFSAVASVRVLDGVDLSTLLDYQPEDHEREGDDSTATLFSVSLTYAF